MQAIQAAHSHSSFTHSQFRRTTQTANSDSQFRQPSQTANSDSQFRKTIQTTNAESPNSDSQLGQFSQFSQFRQPVQTDHQDSAQYLPNAWTLKFALLWSSLAPRSKMTQHAKQIQTPQDHSITFHSNPKMTQHHPQDHPR